MFDEEFEEKKRILKGIKFYGIKFFFILNFDCLLSKLKKKRKEIKMLVVTMSDHNDDNDDNLIWLWLCDIMVLIIVIRGVNSCD